MKPQEFLDWLFGPQGGSSDKRPWHVLDWARSLSDQEGSAFWAVIEGSWDMFDLIPHTEFSAQFTRFSGTAPGSSLTKPVRLYRGQDASDTLGLSWTTSLKSAAGFARGHRGLYNTDPVVFTHIVTPDRVAFTCDERGEQEYVLLSIPNRLDCRIVRRKHLSRT
jgi:hypothetical protein